MKLTEKCKVDFEKWFNATEISDLIIGTVYHYYGDEDVYFYDAFNNLPPSAKYGVYVDFFDSVGVSVEIMPLDCGISYYWLINDNEMNDGETDTRPEARTEAIEKANEIYNSMKDEK
jgi:hypothetical protein